MIAISIQIDGVDRVIASLERTGVLVTQRLRRGIEREGIRLARYVKEEKLSGQVLKNRTGRLRRSINAKYSETANGATSTVGTNVKYAAAHEYGFSDTVTVRAHTRTVTQLFGRVLASPIDVSVASFARKQVTPERSFLRSSMRENASGIQERLLADVHAAVREAKR